ncbi:MAG: purine-nucleoside phosphorylase [Spirochaetaceae bacterium]|nr:MAG: purine-nucleoside phosphorylase [Spirochaetaceae bacterium]
MNTSFPEVVSRAAASIRDSSGRSPRVGVVLGSGLSDVVDDLIGDSAADTIAYARIEGFGGPSVSGHRGTLTISDSVAVMAGRFHAYEGRPMDDVVLPVATLAACGVTTVIVTNAAGGINAAYAPGDLVLITDHLNLMGANPLIGPQDPASLARFVDMTVAYDPELRDLARSIDGELKEGVYAALSGPNYETPAEIRMLRTLGADLVGMSTVPEVLVARSYGMRVLGISTVTNLAAGMSGRPLDHREVVEVGRSIRARMAELLTRLIAESGS